ncbi:MAG: GNAT family N-acetyltransferase [Alphaproteobacteria bacterium]|nr:GNAT family N-acetyltransferase [Alphaproteobacteria bacterium]
MSARIRLVRDSDAAGLIRLIDACWSAYEGCILDVDAEEPQLRAMRSHFDALGGEYWVAEGPGGGIAAGGGWAPAADPAGAELHKLYVLAEIRRQGLARRLVGMAEAAARRRGSRFVELWSDTRFLEAHAFYEALGYRRTGGTRELNDLSNTTEFHFIKAPFTIS